MGSAFLFIRPVAKAMLLLHQSCKSNFSMLQLTSGIMRGSLEKDLITFITATQAEKHDEIKENYKTDNSKEIIKALNDELTKKQLWLIMRDGLIVNGTQLELYKPKPRSTTTKAQEKNFQENIFAFKKEYRYQLNFRPIRSTKDNLNIT